jgi:hypothetical protein
MRPVASVRLFSVRLVATVLHLLLHLNFLLYSDTLTQYSSLSEAELEAAGALISYASIAFFLSLAVEVVAMVLCASLLSRPVTSLCAYLHLYGAVALLRASFPAAGIDHRVLYRASFAAVPAGLAELAQVILLFTAGPGW